MEGRERGGVRGDGRQEKGEGRGGKRGGEEREGRRREGKGGLSVNVAEEAFCLKSAPVVATEYNSYRRQAAESSSFFSSIISRICFNEWRVR